MNSCKILDETRNIWITHSVGVSLPLVRCLVTLLMDMVVNRKSGWVDEKCRPNRSESEQNVWLAVSHANEARLVEFSAAKNKYFNDLPNYYCLIQRLCLVFNVAALCKCCGWWRPSIRRKLKTSLIAKYSRHLFLLTISYWLPRPIAN